MLIAVDTNVLLENVLLDLASGVEDVADALTVIRRKTSPARLIASPTVNLELAYLSGFAEEADLKAIARDSLRVPYGRSGKSSR